MTDPVVLYAVFTARADKTAHVARLISEYGERVRREPGNLVFEVSRLRAAPDRFFVYEAYRDQEAFDEHLRRQAGRSFNEQLTPLIREPASELTFLVRVP